MKTIIRLAVFLYFLYFVGQFVQTHAIGVNPLGFVVFLFFLVVAVL